MGKTVVINESLTELYASFTVYFISLTRNYRDSQYMNIAISGGSTPLGLFKYLSENAKDSIDWSKIRIFWVDERCVSPENDESNYFNALKTLIIPLSLNPDNIFRIKGEDNPKDEAVRYSELVSGLLNMKNGLPVFNLVLLGMGDDGHTASIFPNSFDGADKIYFDTIRPYDNQPRISMSMKTINNAKNIAFIISGKEKRDIFTQIYSSDIKTMLYPASMVSPISEKLVYFIDKQATIYDK